MIHPDSGAADEARPVAIVTGGRQGLGLAAATNLAARGFDVVIADVQPSDDESRRVVTQLEALGARASYHELDLADVDAHAAFCDAVIADHGHIDTLVDNAGIAARPLTDVLDLGVDAFDRGLAVNLRGTFFLTQQVARRMLAAPDCGHYRSIVVVTSIAAALVNTDRSQYCIAKAGLSMVAQLMAVRLAPAGVHVHEVRPGLIATEMTASANTSVPDQWIADGRVPMPRWGRPDDVGATIGSLAAGALPYSTGQPIWVDGGIHLPTAP